MEDNGIQVSHYWEILLPYIKKRRRLECILEYWTGIESIDIHLNSLLKEPRNSDIPVPMGISSTLTLLSKYRPLLKGSRAFSSNYWLASLIAQLVKNLPAMQETRVCSWVGKIPWRPDRLPTPVFWPGEFHGLYSPWGRKESDSTGWLTLSFTFTDFWGGMVGKIQDECRISFCTTI